jgi:hypothetical protein
MRDVLPVLIAPSLDIFSSDYAEVEQNNLRLPNQLL